MKTLVLMIIASVVIHVHSFEDQIHQVTLSCPGALQTGVGPAGIPGKRGNKGETGSKGSY